jgi:histidyl-tRNA synthetase
MSILKAVRGTRDLLPPETALWNRIEVQVQSQGQDNCVSFAELKA